VFESNKVVMSKFGTFVGKSYESGGLFHLSDLNNHSSYHINVVCDNDYINDIWHSHLCHVNLRPLRD
jgi:hypothetical protein